MEIRRANSFLEYMDSFYQDQYCSCTCWTT
uniref:Uncharacterized protein n=1 Tax=Arundo donax TaxID=35708 RepID=A0A0A9FZP6_ARUDO